MIPARGLDSPGAAIPLENDKQFTEGKPVMNTYVVSWTEDEAAYPPKPVGTVGSVVAGMEWCQEQADQLAGKVLPRLPWQHYLSRGSGPGTAHYTVRTENAGTFEVWVLGDLG